MDCPKNCKHKKYINYQPDLGCVHKEACEMWQEKIKKLEAITDDYRDLHRRLDTY